MYTKQAGHSYHELLLMRLLWAQLGLIQNLQALATVENKDESVGHHQFRKCGHP